MQKNQITLFVGDIDESLAIKAKQYDAGAFLIDRDNYKQFLADTPHDNVTVYTSLGDLPSDAEIFLHIAMMATRIVYEPPHHWSDQRVLDPVDPTVCMQGLTENLLLFVSNFRPVENLQHCYFEPWVNPLVDSRKSSTTQFWFAGCSVTHGVGVDNHERYGQLVADKLDMPCSFLTKAGSSIAWAADQILRADLEAGDTVIWGITDTHRLMMVDQQKLHTITLGTMLSENFTGKKIPIDILLNENTFYSHLYSVEQVINHCDKCRVKLWIFGLLTSPNMLRYLATKSNYVHFPHKQKFSDNTLQNQFVDLGTDKLHPGIVQHRHYADFILENVLKI